MKHGCFERTVAEQVGGEARLYCSVASLKASRRREVVAFPCWKRAPCEAGDAEYEVSEHTYSQRVNEYLTSL